MLVPSTITNAHRRGTRSKILCVNLFFMIFLFILMQYFFQNIAQNVVPAVLLCAEALVVLAAEVEPACEKSQIPQGPTVEWSSGVIIL